MTENAAASGRIESGDERPEASRPDAETVVLDPDEVVERENQARRARLRLTLALAILASTVVLAAIGAGTYSAVERSVRGLRAASLKSMLEVQSKTLEVWIAGRKIAIERLARNRQVREHAATLAAIAARPGTTPEQYCAAPARRPLVAELDDAFAGTGAVGFNIIDRSGRIIASSFREYCGLSIRPALFRRELDAVFRGETIFVHPTRDAERLDQPPPRLPLSRPVVWVETPVFDTGRQVVAALSVGHHAHGQFAAILAAARSGETGEVYAFDRRGYMLSESRFTTDLAARGRLAPGERTMLSLVVRPPDAPADALTRLAESALAGVKAGKTEGMLTDAYPGYYGRDVVGAWRWLPQDDMVIGVEISATEAYAPLQVLRLAFSTVFGALVLAVIVALMSWFSAAQLRGGSGERRRIGPYVLGERIGEGGVANIYLASHELLKRPTAVKLLKPARATDEMMARFEREARLASQLSHPNMVEIFDYGRAPGGVLYYAMEYLNGATIGDIVSRDGALPVARATYLLRQVCSGLAEAHGKGLVHRDISATNIMVCRYGGEYDFVKILDFGLVKSISRTEHSQTITRTLRLLGTPLYMAPERLRDPADVDTRADIYAIGAVAFLMLTGRKLFNVKDELALTSSVLNETPPRLSAVAAQPIPRELDELVAACVEKRREDRPQRITDLIQILELIAHDARWTQRDAEAAWRPTALAPHGSGR
jgi:serine/threonine-protein kinase